jgi:hypothetical protein
MINKFIIFVLLTAMMGRKTKLVSPEIRLGLNWHAWEHVTSLDHPLFIADTQSPCRLILGAFLDLLHWQKAKQAEGRLRKRVLSYEKWKRTVCKASSVV